MSDKDRLERQFDAMQDDREQIDKSQRPIAEKPRATTTSSKPEAKD